MRVWRITKAKLALDTSCTLTKKYGGRWNPIGHAAFYAGTTVELCALESFVHLTGRGQPPLALVAIDLPETSALAVRPPSTELPADWAALPVAAASQEFGKAWLTSLNQLLMLVPSAIVPEATNCVINPAHPEFAGIRLSIVRPFTFDARMFKK